MAIEREAQMAENPLKLRSCTVSMNSNFVDVTPRGLHLNSFEIDLAGPIDGEAGGLPPLPLSTEPFATSRDHSQKLGINR